MNGVRLITITARSWDPNTNVYSDNINTEGLRYVGNTNTGTTPPCLLVCNGRNPEILFDTPDRLNNIGPRINRLFGAQIPNEVILFVHGFNVGLTDAIITALNISQNTNRNVVLFDWPSSHSNCLTSIMKGYARDSEMATTSVDALNWVLYLLLDQIANVHIISHSMGSRIAASSLANLVHDYRMLTYNDPNNDVLLDVYRRRLNRLDKLIFKESDIDITNMAKFTSQTVPTINNINQRIQIYIYAHNDDKVLNLSQDIHGDYRVGQLKGAKKLLKKLVQAQDVDQNIIPLHIVNASRCGNTPSIIIRQLWPYGNHSYFNDARFIRSIRSVINGVNLGNRITL